MCVYVYIYVCVYMYVYVCIYIHMNMHNIHIYTYYISLVFTHSNLIRPQRNKLSPTSCTNLEWCCQPTLLLQHTEVYLWIYVYMSVSLYLQLYIHTYKIHMYIYITFIHIIYVYIFTHINWMYISHSSRSAHRAQAVKDIYTYTYL